MEALLWGSIRQNHLPTYIFYAVVSMVLSCAQGSNGKQEKQKRELYGLVREQRAIEIVEIVELDCMISPFQLPTELGEGSPFPHLRFFRHFDAVYYYY